MLDALGHDLRGALRSLRRAPALSTAVVGILGLALAASVATFAVLNAVLLEELPYRAPERVVFLRHVYKEMVAACSPPTFVDYRRETRSFESLSATAPWNASLTGDGEPERLRGLRVSADFFATLGVGAALGRTFVPEEESPGRERVVVVSHGLWQRRFGGDSTLVGRSLILDGLSHEVVGILPPGFEWGRQYGREAQGEVWAPFALTPERIAEDNRGSEYLDVYARLRPGVSVAQAQADVQSVIATLRAQHPRRYTEKSGFGVLAIPLQEELVGSSRAGLVLVLAAVVTLLLVAATNVAGLLLARAAGRRREGAVRTALGASRARLAREALAEALVLAAAAGAGGLSLAWGLTALLETIDRVTLPRARPIAIDFEVAAFALVATLIVALVAGLAPAWHARRDVMAWLRTNPPGAGGRDGARMRRGLIVAQTALALVLLVGAGLLVRSLDALHAVDPGFRSESLLVARVQLPSSRYPEAAARSALFESVGASLAGHAGVRSMAVVSELPLGGEGNSGTFTIGGRPAARGGENLPHAEIWSASPGYFAAMGIDVVRGRAFAATDGAQQALVAVVNEALVRRYFPGQDPLGHTIDIDGEDAPRPRTIVGVVRDVRDRRLDREPEPQAYAAYAQRPTRGAFLVLRTDPDPLTALPALRSAVRSADPLLPLYGVTTMVRLAADDTRDRRAARTALAGFASAGVLLAALGLYALLSQTVRERVPEVGLRISLGARRADVVSLFLKDGARLVAQGLVLGLALALPSSRLLQRFVFGVSTADPLTYAGVAGLLVVVAAAASALPSWRAARVEAWSALRSE